MGIISFKVYSLFSPDLHFMTVLNIHWLTTSATTVTHPFGHSTVTTPSTPSTSWPRSNNSWNGNKIFQTHHPPWPLSASSCLFNSFLLIIFILSGAPEVYCQNPLTHEAQGDQRKAPTFSPSPSSKHKVLTHTHPTHPFHAFCAADCIIPPGLEKAFKFYQIWDPYKKVEFCRSRSINNNSTWGFLNFGQKNIAPILAGMIPSPTDPLQNDYSPTDDSTSEFVTFFSVPSDVKHYQGQWDGWDPISC